jgi:hypothetical protein
MTDEHTLFELPEDMDGTISDVINSDNLTDVAEVARQADNGTYHSGLGSVEIRRSRKAVNISVSFRGNMGTRKDSVKQAMDTIFGIEDTLHKLKYHPKVIKYQPSGHWDYLYEIEIRVKK